MMRYLAFLTICLLLSSTAHAVPRVIQHQGRVLVAGVNFTGTAGFKFALVDAAGTTTFWSNDGTSTAGSEPTGAVALTVTNGVYSVGLGDASLPNMQVVPPSVFIANNDVRLRVWFNDGSHGWQLLTPDQRLAAVAWALSAREAETVADGSVTSAKIASGAVTSAAIANGAVTSAKIANGAVSGSALAVDAVADNLAASGYSGVATGGIVFGHTAAETALTNSGFVAQSAFSVGQTWTPMAGSGVPTARTQASSVWTGTEWIIWGGMNADGVAARLNTGARYNPETNTWTVMSTTNAPTARTGHSAVWTGSQMWVFGGRIGVGIGSLTNTGAIYTPATDTWTTLPSTNAPSAREGHTASWFGTGMLVCGGTDATGVTGTAGRLNDGASAWITPATMGARKNHTSVVNGNYVFVWGGEDNSGTELLTGERFDILTGLWITTNTTNCATARRNHNAVSVGGQVYIWGGYDSAGAVLNTGAIYNVGAQTWTAWNTTNAPSARALNVAAWTGGYLVLWGGVDGAGNALSDGVLYSPSLGTWTPMTTTLSPSARWSAHHVWSGHEVLVWGGSNASSTFTTGSRFNPNTTLWMYVRQ